MRRLVEQSACVHGYFGGCTFKTDSGEPCPGGTSKPVEIDYEAAFAADGGHWPTGRNEAHFEYVKVIVDAALGVGS